MYAGFWEKIMHRILLKLSVSLYVGFVNKFLLQRFLNHAVFYSNLQKNHLTYVKFHCNALILTKCLQPGMALKYGHQEVIKMSGNWRINHSEYLGLRGYTIYFFFTL